MEEWLVNNWNLFLKIIKPVSFVILGGILKAGWDFFTFKRNEKMFYSNEFIKLRVIKINDLIEKLSDFHKFYNSVKANSIYLTKNLDKINYQIRILKEDLILHLANLDKSLTEVGFFIENTRYNALRLNIQSICDSVEDLVTCMVENESEGYTQKNKDNFQKLINNLDLELLMIKQNLSEIMPQEYKFIKNKKFYKTYKKNNTEKANHRELIESTPY